MNYHPGGVGGMNNSGNPQGGNPGYGNTFATSSGMPYTNSLGVSNMGNNAGGGINNTSNTNQMPFGHPSQQTTPTHSPYASSPSSSYANAGKNHASTPLRRYILLPPPKQRKLHRSSDLGNWSRDVHSLQE